MGMALHTGTKLAFALLIAATAPACPSLGSAPEKEPMDKAEFHYQLANNSFYGNDITSAIQDLYTALDFDPNHAKAHHLLGFVYFGRKEYSEAALHFRRAVELDPKFYEARANLGALLVAMERWEDAVSVLEPLAQDRLYPTPHLVHNNMGFAYFHLGDYERALEKLRMAVFLKPEMCLAHNNLGRVYLALGQMEQAVRSFDRATMRCPDYVEPFYWLGELYRSTGQNDLARQSYEKCFSLGPETPIGIKCGELRQ